LCSSLILELLDDWHDYWLSHLGHIHLFLAIKRSMASSPSRFALEPYHLFTEA
jgi:hypothetical protein